ncbi:MAG: hypothetical protein QOD07_2406 [Frankiaceae bacterium]|jgi:uncharacterized membrane protein YkvA (DUF1232 family)|nr:hypothetical protein [Frankiaceae bacterium]
MPWWADLLISLGAAVLVTWVALIVVLLRSGRGLGGFAEAARLLPDVVRLVSRLARDGSLPRGVRIRLWLLLGYLASPIDIVPDFVPVIGYADDALIVALTLRSVVRAAGSEPLDRHWPGTADGLAVVRRLAGISGDAAAMPEARPGGG